jgi:hypothetical protein
METANFVAKFKQTNKYNAFKNVLYKKIENEENAKFILETNLGKMRHEHLKQIFSLVDECYSREACHVMPGPWFGRIIKPNALNIFKTDHDQINQWFNLLVMDQISLSDRIDRLRMGPYRIKGLNIGFITLVLYLLDKSKHSIWLRDHHDGLKILYPELIKFNGKGEQYDMFNRFAKMFAKQYDFDNTELDYIFSGIKYLTREIYY